MGHPLHWLVEDTGSSAGVTFLHEAFPCALGFHSTTPEVQEGVSGKGVLIDPDQCRFRSPGMSLCCVILAKGSPDSIRENRLYLLIER